MLYIAGREHTSIEEAVHICYKDYGPQIKVNPIKGPTKRCSQGLLLCKVDLNFNRSKGNLLLSIKLERMFALQNRRERISERLKILQDLVPNGSKVKAFCIFSLLVLRNTIRIIFSSACANRNKAHAGVSLGTVLCCFFNVFAG